MSDLGQPFSESEKRLGTAIGLSLDHMDADRRVEFMAVLMRAAIINAADGNEEMEINLVNLTDSIINFD
jgi:hypothetical protein